MSMSARGGFFTHNPAMHASETFTIAQQKELFCWSFRYTRNSRRTRKFGGFIMEFLFGMFVGAVSVGLTWIAHITKTEN